MVNFPISRRRLLQVAAALTVLPVLLKTQRASAVELICSDESQLDAAQRAQRVAQHYVDNSPLGAKKNCDNCVVFQAGAAGQANAAGVCGSCLILAGPIHPQGYCDAWTDMT